MRNILSTFSTLSRPAALAIAAAVASTAAACVAPTANEESTAEEARADGAALQILEESDVVIVGTYAFGEGVVRFEARLESPFVKSTLVVNGATYDFALDVVESKLTIDGHSNTILAADAEVLRRLEKAFDRAGSTSRSTSGSTSKIREAMFRTIALMSAAPRGTTVAQKLVMPQVAPEEAESPRWWNYCDNNEDITYLCHCNALPAGCANTFEGWHNSNPMYRSGGIWANQGRDNGSLGNQVAGCEWTPTATHEHEVCESSRQSSRHGRVTWAARCGWSAGQCEGRCGAGCPNSFNFYITKDCLDHDVCLNNHPSAGSATTFGDCGNEFDRASGDFSFGTTDGFTSRCGGPMIGDWSR